MPHQNQSREPARPDRRRTVSGIAVLGAVAALGVGRVLAQPANVPGNMQNRALPADYPSRTLTILVGSSPGSTTDGLARLLGQEFTRQTGQSVVVDNRPGAYGGLAAQAEVRANPDGHTLLITTNTTQAANPHLFKKLTYDPLHDFAPVGQLVQGYMLMVVNPSLGVNSVAEFIALARRRGDKLSFGSGSSSARLAVEMFQHQIGVRMNYVPYKSNPAAVMDLVAGQVDLMIVDLTTSLPQVKAGRLKALAYTGPTRSALQPDVPTMAESGLPGYEAHHWNALYLPAKTPAAVIQRLSELTRQAMQTPALIRFAEQNGMEVAFSSPAELTKFQQAEWASWGRMIQEAGIQAE